jgi:two-component system, NtrC family, nitrogen regulation response regulator NtrX
MKKSLLIVDDELDIQSSLSFALKDEGYDVLTASSPAEAEKLLESNSIDVCLFDVWFPDGDGMELLQLTKQRYPHISPVMMSGHGNIELALKSIRLGAYDFLEKPLELEKVLVVLRNAVEALNLRDENRRLKKQLVGKIHFIGESRPVLNLRGALQKAAQATSHVLVFGENGSGKELVARLLHELSPRRDRPFVAVNCAAIPEGLIESELFGHEKGSFTGAVSRHSGRFEQASDGTLFLDEITELSLAAQGKLLRVLEERTFDRVGGRAPVKAESRVVAATNRDLAAEVKAGRFREDLYFRLNVLSITVPPLRDRLEDVAPLSVHFLKNAAAEAGRNPPEISRELHSWMQTYDWPGNVRELKNIIERMVIMGADQKVLGLADLPEELQALSARGTPVADETGTLRELRAVFEKITLEKRLEKLGGNVTKAAESLGIERAHLHRKMKQFGIGSRNSGSVSGDLSDEP